MLRRIERLEASLAPVQPCPECGRMPQTQAEIDAGAAVLKAKIMAMAGGTYDFAAAEQELMSTKHRPRCAACEKPTGAAERFEAMVERLAQHPVTEHSSIMHRAVRAACDRADRRNAEIHTDG